MIGDIQFDSPLTIGELISYLQECDPTAIVKIEDMNNECDIAEIYDYGDSRKGKRVVFVAE